VGDYYRARLKQSPNALAHLQQRGLVYDELVDTFKLGYADRTLTYRCRPAKTRRARGARQTAAPILFVSPLSVDYAEHTMTSRLSQGQNVAGYEISSCPQELNGYRSSWL
jgi:hypothetical protein